MVQCVVVQCAVVRRVRCGSVRAVRRDAGNPASAALASNGADCTQASAGTKCGIWLLQLVSQASMSMRITRSTRAL